MSINDFRDDDDLLKQQVEPIPIPTPEQVQDPCYIRWHMFDEVPERVYTIECEGYIDKNGRYIDDETTIKHLTSGEHKLCTDDIIECYDENGNFIDYVDFEDAYYCMNYDKYDLRKITKQIRTKKFICEAPIGSGKSTAIHTHNDACHIYALTRYDVYGYR